MIKPEWCDRVWDTSSLSDPLRWRKPARVFVNSMSDLFHESLPDEAIAAVFVAMAAAPQHTFIVLTKRAERMRRFMTGHRLSYEDFVGVAAFFVGSECNTDAVIDAAWARYRAGLSNLWLGVSVEDQPSADERIPHLLATPAAKRVVSYEPALGPVDFRNWIDPHGCHGHSAIGDGSDLQSCDGCIPYIDWVIVGGESGPGARPCDVAWIRSARDQCRAAGVPIFVKQLGANSIARCVEDFGDEQFRAWDSGHANEPFPLSGVRVPFRSRKGSDPSEWPEDLRVREWPESSR